MNGWTKLTYLLWPSRRRAEEREMQEELASLRELDGGRELGNLTLAAENAREVWTWMWLERLAQDVRYAVRSMAHNKAFAAVAILSLALGIGATTAIYSFTEAILIRSLPVPEPRALVVMRWHAKTYTSAASSGFSYSTGGTHSNPGQGTIGTQFPYQALAIFQQNTGVLSSAFGYFAIDRLNVTVGGETEVVRGQYVSGDYFRGMAAPPAAGRLLFGNDDEAGAAPIVVLGHRYAQRRFGSAGQAVGQAIRVNDTPFTVVGVTQPAFFGAEPGSVPDVYLALRTKPMVERSATAAGLPQAYLDPNFYWIEIMGRLRPGISLEQAQSALGPQFRRFVEESATTDRQRADLPDLRLMRGAAGLDSLRRQYWKPLSILMAMVAVMLAIACANVANLLLARATARRREIAIRLGIGASRRRVIRQLLTESVVLSSIGGLLGVGIAYWGIRLLTALMANGRENFTLHAELNWRVLAVTLAISVLTGLLFGLAPALQATRVDLLSALKEIRAGALAAAARRPRLGLTQGLVVAQIALSLVLLVAAVLFGRTLGNLHGIELGFNREDVLLFTIRPGAAGYEGPARGRLYAELQERVSQIPGVRNVSLSARALPAGGGSMTLVTAEAAPPPPPPVPGQPAPNAAGVFTIGPSFFATMQIPLIGGREFDGRDVPGGTPVAIINQRLATVLKLQSPLGSTIRVGLDNTYQVVGVVSDALFLYLKEQRRPMVYFPYTQGSGFPSPAFPSQMTYEVRAAGNGLAHAGTVRQIVREIDSRLAVSDVKTQAAHIDQAISLEIALARLCSAFAILALVIACVGLYGTVAFAVTRRTGEIGIRMALGAQRTGILWMILRSVVVLELVGLAIGLPIVLTGSRYVESLLFGIAPTDPAALALAAGILLTAGLAASIIPARRAASIDPMAALRHE
jgi:predicted permease